MDMIPAKNHVGNPDVVAAVPIYPKLGNADAPTASDPDVPMNDPADNPELLRAVWAVDPVMIDPANVPRLPTNGASRNVKLLVADATDVVADVARLTNHETLLVAFCVSAVIPLAAAMDMELNVIFVVPVNADAAASPPDDMTPAVLSP